MTSALEDTTAEAIQAEESTTVLAKAEPRRNDKTTLASEILEKLTYSIGKYPAAARRHDWLEATTLAVRDRIIDHWLASRQHIYESGEKRVCYLSMEFLIGRLLRDAISNLGLTEAVTEALAEYDVSLDMIELLEPDAALEIGRASCRERVLYTV